MPPTKRCGNALDVAQGPRLRHGQGPSSSTRPSPRAATNVSGRTAPASRDRERSARAQARDLPLRRLLPPPSDLATDGAGLPPPRSSRFTARCGHRDRRPSACPRSCGAGPDPRTRGGSHRRPSARTATCSSRGPTYQEIVESQFVDDEARRMTTNGAGRRRHHRERRPRKWAGVGRQRPARRRTEDEDSPSRGQPRRGERGATRFGRRDAGREVGELQEHGPPPCLHRPRAGAAADRPRCSSSRSSASR